MSSLSIIVVAGLVTWRITSLLYSESMFTWLRSRIDIMHDQEGKPISYPSTWLGTTFECFWCLSLLVALPVSLLVGAIYSFHWGEFLLAWLSGSTVAILIEKWMFRSRSRLD